MADPTSTSEAARGGRDFEVSTFLIFEGIAVVNLRNPDAQQNLAILEAMAVGQARAAEAISATRSDIQFNLAMSIAVDLISLMGLNGQTGPTAVATAAVLGQQIRGRLDTIEAVYGPVFSKEVEAYVGAILASPANQGLIGVAVQSQISFPMSTPFGELTQEEFEAFAPAPMNFGPQTSNPGAGFGGTSGTNTGFFSTIDSNGNITNTVTGQNIGNSTVSAPPANDPSTASNPGLDGPW